MELNETMGTDTTRYFKIEIVAAGGEYGYGVVEDPEAIALLRDNIDNDCVALENGNDKTRVVFFQVENELFHSYGPDVTQSRLSISVHEDEDCEEEIETLIDYTNIGDTDCHVFTLTNPWIRDEDKKKYSEDALEFGGFYTEKRIHFPVCLKIEEDEKFDTSNVYIGTTNMDETLSGDEIVTQILYIKPQQAQEIMNIYMDEENCDMDAEPLCDHIGEIYDDIEQGKFKDIQKILNSCMCEVGEIEGKGESEEHFAIIKDMSGNILFDGECDYSN